MRERMKTDLSILLRTGPTPAMLIAAHRRDGLIFRVHLQVRRSGTQTVPFLTCSIEEQDRANLITIQQSPARSLLAAETWSEIIEDLSSFVFPCGLSAAPTVLTPLKLYTHAAR